MDPIVKRLLENHQESYSPEPGDICVYHYSRRGKEVPRDTFDYYRTKEGSKCIVIGKVKSNIVPIVFLDEEIYYITPKNSPECLVDDLEFILRGAEK